MRIHIAHPSMAEVQVNVYIANLPGWDMESLSMVFTHLGLPKASVSVHAAGQPSLG